MLRDETVEEEDTARDHSLGVPSTIVGSTEVFLELDNFGSVREFLLTDPPSSDSEGVQGSSGSGVLGGGQGGGELKLESRNDVPLFLAELGIDFCLGIKALEFGKESIVRGGFFLLSRNGDRATFSLLRVRAVNASSSVPKGDLEVTENWSELK